jgi:flagellar assembly protein FliH
MLSKVLKDTTADVQPVSWRRSLAVPGRAIPAGRTSNEASQLRGKQAELNANAEQQSRQAYESGFRCGETAAREALDGEIRTVVERLAGAIAEVSATRADTIRRAEADTVRLAIEIARRVLHRELSVDPSALEALIRAAMDKLQSQEIYRVRVHPDQANLVRGCLQQMGRGPAVEVIADPMQPTGGAVFEISRGTLDASVDTQLEEIERGLTDQLEARL